ncbi:hypothetical protein HQ545_03650 [Candidatus Woesearchaeota archaeon]|nr:hypothetical protein [Candidatus Woesearchaeota archaeon]
MSDQIYGERQDYHKEEDVVPYRFRDQDARYDPQREVNERRHTGEFEGVHGIELSLEAFEEMDFASARDDS